MPKKQYFKPKVVMSIHGYLSKGGWQLDLSEVIIENGLLSKEFKYGFTIRFDSFKQSRLVDRFREWYFNQVNGLRIEEPFHRPSIVAHSLGSWIVAKAMLKYDDIKFDKVFLHGSIVPRDFDWYTLILRDQVNRITVEKSKRDWVLYLSFVLTGSFYPCGRYGFIQKCTFIKTIDVSKFSHSDFQYRSRWENQIKNQLIDPPTQLRVVHGSDISMKELKRYFKETLKIDMSVYGQDYLERPVTLNTALEWAEVEKNIWSIMLNSYSNKVVGYINTIAVDDETMLKFLNGEIAESDIQASSLVSFSVPGSLNIIVMSIALSKETLEHYGGVLGSKPGELLIISLADKLAKLSEDGRKLKKIGSIAWTPPGEALCKAIGLDKNGKSIQGHPIYSTTTSQLKSKTDIHPLCKWWLHKINN
jgi:hypothetical protein